MRTAIAIILLIAAISCFGTFGAYAAPEWRYPSGILFPKPESARGPYRLIWQSIPSLKQTEAVMPLNASSAGRTQWQCAISDEGRLQDCKLQAEWPVHHGFGDAARSLLPEMRLSSDTVQYSQQNNAKAIFELDIYNEGMSVADIPGDCPVPFCAPAEPPPPAPVR